MKYVMACNQFYIILQSNAIESLFSSYKCKLKLDNKIGGTLGGTCSSHLGIFLCWFLRRPEESFYVQTTTYAPQRAELYFPP